LYRRPPQRVARNGPGADLPVAASVIILAAMANKSRTKRLWPSTVKPCALVDTRGVYCGDNLEQLARLPDERIDLISGGIDPPLNSNRTGKDMGEVLGGKRRRIAPLKTATPPRRPTSPPCGLAASNLPASSKKIGSFYYHYDWHVEATKGQLDAVKFLD
jgi:hypothetical protein